MADTKFSSGQTSGFAAALNNNFSNRPQAVQRQDAGTNVAVQGQYIQHGWAFTKFPGSSQTTTSKTITLPTAYDDTNYDIIVTTIGVKNDADPTSRTDLTSLTNMVSFVYMNGTTSFLLQSATVDGTNGYVGARILVSWMTIGTKL